jgi:hypothetical protein
MSDPRPLEIAAEATPPAAVTFSEVAGVPVATVSAGETPPPPAPAPEPAPTPPPEARAPVAISAELVAQVAAALTAAGPIASPPAVPVAVVRAEALDYLRAGAPFSFVRDGFAVRESADPDARDRLARFSRMVEAGALTAGRPLGNAEVSAALLEAANEPTRAGQPSLIPPGYRADLYVDQVAFPRPLVDAVAQAPISDATPFSVPRFTSGTNMTQDVAAEGVNPAAGVIATTLVTVTPKAVSGIYDASRELVDSSGGGVAVDMIALGAMRESWAQQTETRLATELLGAGNGTDVPAGAAPTAATLLTGISREIIALANRRKAAPTRVLADALAYSVLATDNASDGRPLLPWSAYTTSNVAGRTEAILGANIMGVGTELAWALTLAIVVLERGSVYNFESPALTFTFPEVIGPAQIRFAIFGYQAARVLRPAGVTRYTYTGIPVGLEGSSLLNEPDPEAEGTDTGAEGEGEGRKARAK